MTQKTKLEIIGPYTPEHEGPFCLDDKNKTPVELKIRDGRGEYPLAGYIGYDDILRQWRVDGKNFTYGFLMNAREVPVAREFWVNEYTWGLGDIKKTHFDAVRQRSQTDFIRTIHVHEVLPGEGA
ncbi:MAG: hypothetical protein [Caudoviricetes sp.]|nr:MAG: hypothetical protein [Caudoviricetes sp.]